MFTLLLLQVILQVMQTGNLTGDVLSTGGQTILDSGTDGTNASIRLSTNNK